MVNTNRKKKKNPISSEIVPLGTLLVNYSKDPDHSDIQEIIISAISGYPNDTYPHSVETIEDLIAYYYELLDWPTEGDRDESHYLKLAKEIYWWGHLDDAIAYLNRGIEQLKSDRFSEIFRLKESYEIAKIYIGADEYLTDEVSKAAHCDIDLLIEGETGTGKEIVAREVHNRSTRRNHLFLAISCSEISPTLIESELFGYVKGAFTDAKIDREGIFKAAGKGTAFLDEVDSLDPHQQARLLRFLQERDIKPVGSVKREKVDMRVLCATNRNVLEMVNNGDMRADLYYRIGIFTISLLPLRFRKHTIPDLVDYFVEKYRDDDQKPIAVTYAAIKILQDYSWPGNVRELENLIRVIVSTTNDGVITPGHLDAYFKRTSEPVGLLTKAAAQKWTERKLIEKYQEIILAECGGNKTDACKILGIDRSTFAKRRIKKTMKNSIQDFYS